MNHESQPLEERLVSAYRGIQSITDTYDLIELSGEVVGSKDEIPAVIVPFTDLEYLYLLCHEASIALRERREWTPELPDAPTPWYRKVGEDGVLRLHDADGKPILTLRNEKSKITDFLLAKVNRLES